MWVFIVLATQTFGLWNFSWIKTRPRFEGWNWWNRRAQGWLYLCMLQLILTSRQPSNIVLGSWLMFIKAPMPVSSWGVWAAWLAKTTWSSFAFHFHCIPNVDQLQLSVVGQWWSQASWDPGWLGVQLALVNPYEASEWSLLPSLYDAQARFPTNFIPISTFYRLTTTNRFLSFDPPLKISVFLFSLLQRTLS